MITLGLTFFFPNKTIFSCSLLFQNTYLIDLNTTEEDETSSSGSSSTSSSLFSVVELNSSGGSSSNLVVGASASASASASSSSSVCLELRHGCAGPLISLPKKGSVVVYFPQGQLEQLSKHHNVTILTFIRTPSPIQSLKPIHISFFFNISFFLILF